MLVSSNDVAKRLKITNRAVQNKCKQYGLKKISNQYQITTAPFRVLFLYLKTKTYNFYF